MKFEEHIQFLFDFNPDLFQNRQNCLNDIFCTLGNGLKWINGELVDSLDYSKEIPKVKEKAKQNKKPKYKHSFKFRNDYPSGDISKKYSPFFNFPNNITIDWLNGLIEAIENILICDEKNELFSEITKEELQQQYEKIKLFKKEKFPNINE